LVQAYCGNNTIVFAVLQVAAIAAELTAQYNFSTV